mmetsp:Transcript_13728/g.58692  ORF Transcript_13728/g.58692 Transcript_13728/m.58692 type:complete len:207 (-) Transcript_13728:769-1389(-)
MPASRSNSLWSYACSPAAPAATLLCPSAICSLTSRSRSRASLLRFPARPSPSSRRLSLSRSRRLSSRISSRLRRSSSSPSENVSRSRGENEDAPSRVRSVPWKPETSSISSRAAASPRSRRGRDSTSGPPTRSTRALCASSRSSSSLAAFSLLRISCWMRARVSTASRAFCSARYRASERRAKLSLICTSCSPRPSAASRLSSGIV